MAGTFLVRITVSSGEIVDLRYRCIWSAWLDGRLLGQGHAFKEEEAIACAQECVDPEEIDDMRVAYRPAHVVGRTRGMGYDAVREAAPDLLAACKMALDHMWGEEIDGPTAHELDDALRAAVAKAEGGE